MISENERRDWIEVGVYATLSKVYDVVTKILVANMILSSVLVFFAPPAIVLMVYAGISMGMLIFMIVTACTVKADKISRKEAM